MICLNKWVKNRGLRGRRQSDLHGILQVSHVDVPLSHGPCTARAAAVVWDDARAASASAPWGCGVPIAHEQRRGEWRLRPPQAPDLSLAAVVAHKAAFSVTVPPHVLPVVDQP